MSFIALLSGDERLVSKLAIIFERQILQHQSGSTETAPWCVLSEQPNAKPACYWAA